MKTERIRAGTLADLEGDRVLAVPLAPDRSGTPREGLVLYDESGVIRAYVNRCKHLPIPLDGGSKRYLDDDHRFLMCGTHGALYRRGDGYCFIGPCRGESLDALDVEVDAGGTIWVDRDSGS